MQRMAAGSLVPRCARGAGVCVDVVCCVAVLQPSDITCAHSAPDMAWCVCVPTPRALGCVLWPRAAGPTPPARHLAGGLQVRRVPHTVWRCVSHTRWHGGSCAHTCADPVVVPQCRSHGCARRRVCARAHTCTHRGVWARMRAHTRTRVCVRAHTHVCGWSCSRTSRRRLTRKLHLLMFTIVTSYK